MCRASVPPPAATPSTSTVGSRRTPECMLSTSRAVHGRAGPGFAGTSDLPDRSTRVGPDKCCGVSARNNRNVRVGRDPSMRYTRRRTWKSALHEQSSKSLKPYQWLRVRRSALHLRIVGKGNSRVGVWPTTYLQEHHHRLWQVYRWPETPRAVRYTPHCVDSLGEAQPGVWFARPFHCYKVPQRFDRGCASVVHRQRGLRVEQPANAHTVRQ